MFKGFGAGAAGHDQFVVNPFPIHAGLLVAHFRQLGGAVGFIGYTYKRSEKMQHTVDRLVLRARLLA